MECLRKIMFRAKLTDLTVITVYCVEMRFNLVFQRSLFLKSYREQHIHYLLFVNGDSSPEHHDRLGVVPAGVHLMSRTRGL